MTSLRERLRGSFGRGSDSSSDSNDSDDDSTGAGSNSEPSGPGGGVDLGSGFGGGDDDDDDDDSTSTDSGSSTSTGATNASGDTLSDASDSDDSDPLNDPIPSGDTKTDTTSTDTDDTGGEQTPLGAPPDPDSGPSPDTESDGPGAPDFDRDTGPDPNDFFGDTVSPSDVEEFADEGGELDSIEDIDDRQTRQTVSNVIGDNITGVDPTASETRDVEISDGEIETTVDEQATKEKARQTIAEQNPNVTAEELTGQVTVEDTGDGQPDVGLTDFGEDLIQLGRGAESIESRTDFDGVEKTDVQVSPRSGSVQFTPDTQKELVASQTGVPKEDIKELEATGGGRVRPKLTREAKKRRAAQDASRQFGRDVPQSDIELTDSGYRLAGSTRERIVERQVKEQVGRRQAGEVGGALSAQEARSRVDLEEGRDFTVEETDDGRIQVEITDEFKQRQRAEGASLLADRARQLRRRARQSQQDSQQSRDLPTEKGPVQSRGLPIKRTQTAVGTNKAPEPEDIEGQGPVQEFLSPVTGAPGETERRVRQRVGQAVSPVTEPLFGPPGQAEQAVRERIYQEGELAEDRGETFQSTVIEPSASGAGETVTDVFDLGATVAEVAGKEETAEDIDTTGDFAGSVTTRVLTGVGGVGTEIVRSPQTTIRAAAITGGAARYTQEQIEKEGLDEGIERSFGAGADVAGKTTQAAVSAAAANPYRTAGGILGGYLFGAGVARGIGVAGRAINRRTRTVGATKLEENDFSQQSVIEGEERFPGATNEQRYREKPPAQVQEQARDMTPQEIRREFREAGVEGVTLKKALPVEPEGPERGRSATGFKSAVDPEDETGIDPEDITEEQVVSASDSPGEFSYENPGSFVSTDISRYFLGDEVAESGSASSSLKPGLPDIRGGQSTVVAVRTDVDSPDADTQLQFAREMAEREGETTAFTKPRGSKELNPEEIEAVIPPGSEFADVGTGPVRNTLRRLGVGADYSVDIDGTEVPLRLVASEDDLSAGSRSLRGLRDDNRGQVGAAGGGRTRVRRDLDEIRRRNRGQPEDRTLPIVSSGQPTERSETSTQTNTDDVSRPRGTDQQSDSQPSSTRFGRDSSVGGSFTVGGSRNVASETRDGGSSGVSVPSEGGSSPGVSRGFSGSSPGTSVPGGSSIGTSGFSESVGGSSISTAGGSGGGGGSSGGGSSGSDGRQRRFRLPDIDGEPDEGGVTPFFGGGKKEITYDFRNPLSGGILQTEPAGIEEGALEEPELLGFKTEDT